MADEQFNNLGDIKRKHGKGFSIGHDIWNDISKLLLDKIRLFKKLKKKQQWCSNDYFIYDKLIKEFKEIGIGVL